MKKTYSTPVIEVERFDVADIITTSVAPNYNVIEKNGSAYEVEIVSKW